MKREELIVMRDLLGDIIEANDSLEVARTEHNDAKALHDEIHRLEDKLAYLAKENAEHHDGMIKAQTERDDARRENDCLREGLEKIVRFGDTMVRMSDDDQKTRITKKIVANKFVEFARAALAAASGESEEGGAK